MELVDQLQELQSCAAFRYPVSFSVVNFFEGELWFVLWSIQINVKLNAFYSYEDDNGKKSLIVNVHMIYLNNFMFH